LSGEASGLLMRGKDREQVRRSLGRSFLTYPLEPTGAGYS